MTQLFLCRLDDHFNNFPKITVDRKIGHFVLFRYNPYSMKIRFTFL